MKQEQQTIEAIAQESVAENRKPWQAPQLRTSQVDRDTQNTFTGMVDAGSLLS